jgi:hypothetical protein
MSDGRPTARKDPKDKQRLSLCFPEPHFQKGTKMSRNTPLGRPAPFTSSNANSDEIEIVCYPTTDLRLAEEARQAHVALYMTGGGRFIHPAQTALRECLTTINQAAADPNGQEVALIATRRRTIAAALGLDVFTGTSVVRVSGIEIRALLVYCASPEADLVTVTLPKRLLCPPTRSEVH